MKFKLVLLSLILVSLCYFTNRFIPGPSEQSSTTGDAVKIVINGSTYGGFYQTDSPTPPPVRREIESEAMDAVVRLAQLPREERKIQYQKIIDQDTKYSRLVQYIYEHGHLPQRSGIGSFLDVPQIYAFFSGTTPRDAFEQAHMRSALKYYREPLTLMKDPNGMDRLTLPAPGNS